MSPPYLFTEGDLFFPLRGQGMFYAVDLIFFLLGCFFLFNKRKIYIVCAGAYLLIGALPQMLFESQSDYSLHLAMMFPVMVVCIGYGIDRTLACSPKQYRFLLTGCIAVLYLASVTNFGYAYFFKHPLQEYGDVHMRILSEYMLLNQKRNIPVSFYSDSNIDFLDKYLFYTNSLNRNTIVLLRKTKNVDGLELSGIHFYGCDSSLDMSNIPGVVIIDTACSPKTTRKHLSISRIDDAGEIYKIYDDILCSTYNLQRYPNHITHAQLAIDSLHEKQFCETYINRR